MRREEIPVRTGQGSCPASGRRGVIRCEHVRPSSGKWLRLGSPIAPVILIPQRDPNRGSSNRQLLVGRNDKHRNGRVRAADAGF